MAQAPLVSVIMPTYNPDPGHLHEAIASILEQTYKNIELIIVNDGSTTMDPKEVIDAFGDPRIVYINRKQNQGLTKCLNIALNHSRGEFIARMDDDDISLPQRIEKQVKFFQDYPDANVVGSNIQFFSSKEGIFQVSLDEDRERQQILLLLGNIGIPHPTAMFRKAFLEKYNIRYNEKYKKSQDYAMWVECVKYSRIDWIPEVLLKYRVHEKQISMKNRREQSLYDEMIKIDQLTSIGLHPDKNQKQVHLKFCRMAPDINVKETEQWVQELLRFNQERRVFNHEKFHDIITRHWFAICYENVVHKKDFRYLVPLVKWIRMRHIKKFISRIFRSSDH